MLCINYLSTEIGLRPYSVIICSISYRIVEDHNPRLTDGQMKEEGQAILNMRAEDRSRCFSPTSHNRPRPNAPLPSPGRITASVHGIPDLCFDVHL